MRKVSTHVLMGLACFSIMPSLLLSLPTSPEVVSGSANISVVDQQSMVIEVEDQSIINYRSFNIAAEEMVRFVQPSSSSTVLNRVTGDDASEILGRMQSNGKVFLVNPNGVFFGSDAQVDMGSLITSTLDIADSDFLNGNFEFTLEMGDEEACIVNQGILRARGDGSIALISPNVKNEGTIIANAGKVLLASGEKVVLDFIGDGLMQFSVEGSLEKAMIQQVGSIEALQGQVHLTMSHVKQVIQNVINTDGIEVAGEIAEENGIIRLLSTSKIFSRAVHVAAEEGSKVEVRGEVDVSNIEGIGGSIYVFGEEISIAANLNATGAEGGGEILIGGNAFGQGPYFTAKSTKVYPGSILTADAAVSGNGGKIVVWSNGTTYFDGVARAQGSISGGDGGFIETSGKMGLALAVGSADTSAPFGKMGTWLLDPFAIVINNTGTDSLASAQNVNDITSTVTINASIFANSTSNVTLSAMEEGGSITVAEDTTISMAPGYGITFSVDPENGDIFLANNSQVKTEGGAITFNGKVSLSGDNATLRTDNNFSSGSILFNSTVDGTNAALSNLTIKTGSEGSLVFTGPVGSLSALGTVSIDTGTLNLGTNIFTKGQDVFIRGATLLTADSVIDSTYGGSYSGGDVSFLGVESSINGPYGFTIESGMGRMCFEGNVGDAQALRSFRAKGGESMLSGNGFVTDGNTQIWETAVVVQTDMTFTDNGTSGVFFLSTLNSGTAGAVSVTVSAPIGTAYFVGAVGGGTALANLTVSASEIVQVNKVTLLNSAGSTSALSYSAPLGIAVGGDILAGAANSSPGTLTFNNPVLFTANVGSVATAGTLALAVLSGTSTASSVTINGVSVGSGNLRINGDTRTTIAFQNAAINLVSLNADGDSIAQDANSAIFATGSITLDVANGASAKSLTTLTSISTTAGTITLNGGATVDTIASNIDAGTGNIVLTPSTIPMSYQGVIQTSGGSVTFNSGTGVGVTLTGATKVDVGDGSVTFNRVEGAQSLTIAGGGVATLTLSGIVGGSAALTGLTADIGAITQSSTVNIAGDLAYVAPLGITIGGSITTTSSGDVTIVGPVTLTSGSITVTAGNNISFDGATSTIISPTTARALTLTPGASSIVTLGGAIGTGNPLASLSVTTGSQVSVGSNITVATTGAIAFTPAVVLTGDSTMTSTTGAITFSSTLDGTQALNINTGGTGVVTFAGAVGGTNYLSGLNVVGASIAVNTTTVNVVGGETILNGPTALGANVTFINNGGGVAFLGALTGAGSSTLTVTSPIGIVRFGSTIATTIGTVTVTGLDVEQLGAITPATNGSIVFSGSNSILLGAVITATGTGVITMNNPVTLGTTITLTTATGNVTLSGVTEGSGGLTINTTTGAVSLGLAPYGLSSLTVASSSAGSITQTSVAPITTIGLLSLTSTGGTVTTGASLISEGGNITLSGTTLAITSNIATTGGNISLTGTTTYNGATSSGGTISTGNGNLTVANNLALTADTAVNIGSGTGTFSGTINGAVNFSVNGSAIGTLTMSGAVGTGTSLTSVLAEVGIINQSGALQTTGAVSYNATAGLTLGGGITTSGTSGTITVMGPTTLSTGAIALATTNKNISFLGSDSSIDGAQALTFSSGTSNIRLDGAIGLNTALTSLATTSTGNTLLGSSITTTGAQTFGASASTGNILLTGPVALGTTNSNVTFNGTINGAQSLFVNAGTGTVTYQSAVGSVTALTSLDTIAGSIIVNASIKTR